MTTFEKSKVTEHGGQGDGGSLDQRATAATRTAPTAEPPKTPSAPAIPPELQQAVAAFGADIRSRFPALSEPKAAQRTAHVFLRGLRGPRNTPGRKPYPATTKALRLLESLELQQMSKKKRWQAICKQVIPDWAQLTAEHRSGARRILQDRVYARRRKRRQRRERVGSPPG